MPLLSSIQTQDTKIETGVTPQQTDPISKTRPALPQSQLSQVAKTVIKSRIVAPTSEPAANVVAANGKMRSLQDRSPETAEILKGLNDARGKIAATNGGTALTDTPVSTAPTTPIMAPSSRGSNSPQTRPRAATTLDIPGLTKSKVSPDGKISQRDLGSKLVIVMVGLPARGKSYITKKLARYLNWLQHDTKIFNVGERRRIAAHAHAGNECSATCNDCATDAQQDAETGKFVSPPVNGLAHTQQPATPPTSPATQVLLNGGLPPPTPPFERLPPSAIEYAIEEQIENTKVAEGLYHQERSSAGTALADADREGAEQMDQNAEFFDPNNEKASQFREQLAMETLDELLDFILEGRGSVGIFDATNSTHERRRAIVNKIRTRAGPDLNVLFLESLCIDENLLEANMRLKLSGPDYKDQDPVTALDDFKKRVKMYQKKYVSLGDYEEKNDMPYIQMIDVGRKIISHQIRGFLSAQTNYYLLNFNLAPRQIWITRHGESQDNVKGLIGGDSDLTDTGRAYARALTAFVQDQRRVWEVRQQDKAASTHFPPQPGDTTPPNPAYESQDSASKNFCVWTSMLKRSIQTAQCFDEEEFDVKQMKMLDELNAGMMEGRTYEEIKEKFSAEYELRKQDKLHYRYPGAGGEGYLDIINRLRPVIHEVERMTDHVLLVGHRSVARVLLAYFKGLNREDVADLDVPLGVLYMLEPKPYGVDFKAYRYDPETMWFHEEPEYELRRARQQTPS